MVDRSHAPMRVPVDQTRNLNTAKMSLGGT